MVSKLAMSNTLKGLRLIIFLAARAAPEADGYLISVANRRDKLLTEIVVLDTAKIAQGPIAIIELPFRLRAGIHGSWVMGSDLPREQDLCDMHGISEKVKKEFGKPVTATNGQGHHDANGGI